MALHGPSVLTPDPPNVVELINRCAEGRVCKAELVPCTDS